MGADGGVCWLEVTDEAKFRALVEPLGFLRFDDHHPESWDWHKENAEPDKLYGTYGTDHILSLIDIPDVLGEIEEIQKDTCHWIHIGKREMTFEELALDWETRPKRFKNTYWVLDRLAYYHSSRVPKEVAHLKIVEWGDRVGKLVIPNSLGWVETWT